jgi:hypothetical protein
MHPIVDRAWVDRDPPLSQPLRHIGVAEAEAQVLADSQRDDLIWEAVAAEGRGGPSSQSATTRLTAPQLPTEAIPPCLGEHLASTSVALHAHLLPPGEPSA